MVTLTNYGYAPNAGVSTSGAGERERMRLFVARQREAEREQAIRLEQLRQNSPFEQGRVAAQRLALMDANAVSLENATPRVPAAAFGMTVGTPGARTAKPDPLGAPAPIAASTAGGMPIFTRFDEDSAPTAAVRPAAAPDPLLPQPTAARPPTNTLVETVTEPPTTLRQLSAIADRRRGVMEGVGAPPAIAGRARPAGVGGLPPLPDALDSALPLETRQPAPAAITSRAFVDPQELRRAGMPPAGARPPVPPLSPELLYEPPPPVMAPSRFIDRYLPPNQRRTGMPAVPGQFGPEEWPLGWRGTTLSR